METLIYEKRILIFGCGNTLFGNDGFGPEVVNYLNEHAIMPDCVLALDAGTGIRDFVFDLLLMEKKPEMVLIIDAATIEGKKPGDLFESSLTNVPKKQLSVFSLHQSPSSNLLAELKEQGVDVRVYCVHTDEVPNIISPGLSDKIKEVIPDACAWINKQVKTFIIKK